MTYALVPDGFTLKKVTKEEEEAIKDHRRHEDIKTFLDNETTPILIGATALTALTPIIFNFFLKLLEEQNIIITDPQRDALKTGLQGAGPAGWALLSLEKQLNLSGIAQGSQYSTLTTISELLGFKYTGNK